MKAIVEVILTIAITLARAGRLSDVAAGDGALTGQSVPASTARPAASDSMWASNPFSPLLAHPISPAWASAGRS